MFLFLFFIFDFFIILIFVKLLSVNTFDDVIHYFSRKFFLNLNCVSCDLSILICVANMKQVSITTYINSAKKEKKRKRKLQGT